MGTDFSFQLYPQNQERMISELSIVLQRLFPWIDFYVSFKIILPWSPYCGVQIFYSLYIGLLFYYIRIYEISYKEKSMIQLNYMYALRNNVILWIYFIIYLNHNNYMSFPSIHDAYGGFGERSNMPTNPKQRAPPSNQQLTVPPPPAIQEGANKDNKDNGKYPSDASNSNYPIKIRCPKCSNVCMSRMSSQMGAAAWVWCVLLAPFACVGITCLCIESCRDKIHFCTRCGGIVGKKFAKVC